MVKQKYVRQAMKLIGLKKPGEAWLVLQEALAEDYCKDCAKKL